MKKTDRSTVNFRYFCFYIWIVFLIFKKVVIFKKLLMFFRKFYINIFVKFWKVWNFFLKKLLFFFNFDKFLTKGWFSFGSVLSKLNRVVQFHMKLNHKLNHPVQFGPNWTETGPPLWRKSVKLLKKSIKIFEKSIKIFQQSTIF